MRSSLGTSREQGHQMASGEGEVGGLSRWKPPLRSCLTREGSPSLEALKLLLEWAAPTFYR